MGEGAPLSADGGGVCLSMRLGRRALGPPRAEPRRTRTWSVPVAELQPQGADPPCGPIYNEAVWSGSGLTSKEVSPAVIWNMLTKAWSKRPNSVGASSLKMDTPRIESGRVGWEVR